MSPLQHIISISVDLDAIRFYYDIHGLASSALKVPDPVWALGVPRFLDLFAELGIRATFFIVASDLATVSNGGVVQEATEVQRRQSLVHTMLARGHEIASHSFRHDYALSQCSFQEICRDLQHACNILQAVADIPICGFRAPGYNLSRPLIDAIQASNATYSSSRLPSPPYFIAKWLVMLKQALKSQPSRSIVGEVIAPFFSRQPYRHPGGLLELPVSVIPWLRLPAIGTFFTLYGKFGWQWLSHSLAREPWINLEFHGIDLIDTSDVGIEKKLSSLQPDLPVPLKQKRILFSHWLSHLSQGKQNKTLEEVANHYEQATP